MTVQAVPDRTAAALVARRRRTDQKLDAVAGAIARLHRLRQPVQVAAVARMAGVSRTFLYENIKAKQLLADGLTVATPGDGAVIASDQDREAAAWRERALNCEEALKGAMGEVHTQRQTIADLLGQVRQFDGGQSEDHVRRLMTLNTDLKAQVRDLTEANRTLAERLGAARGHARFLDKRAADLETELIENAATAATDPEKVRPRSRGPSPLPPLESCTGIDQP